MSHAVSSRRNKGLSERREWRNGDFAFASQQTSPAVESLGLSSPLLFLFFFPSLFPPLNLSEMTCFWLTDSRPHLVTCSCCQHSFPEKSSCLTLQPWSAAKRETEKERKRERDSQSQSWGDLREPSQSGAGSLV